MSKCPEHDKLGKVADKTQAAGEFIDWLEDEKNVHLAIWMDDARMVPAGFSIERLLAEWQRVDLDRLEDEKLAMLAAVRAANESRR